jgi:hypothetical protein
VSELEPRAAGRARRRRLGAALGACLAGAVCAGGPAADSRFPLQFESEVVRLFVEPDSVRVEGLYRFACTDAGGSDIALAYPYPADSLMGGARTLYLRARAPGGLWEPAVFTEAPRGRGVRWRLPGCTADTMEAHTEYRQARRANHAVYIVTTTRAWGRPLRRARFEVYLPPGATEPRFSHPFEYRAARGPQERPGWVLEARDFLPDREIVVDWNEGAPGRQVP